MVKLNVNTRTQKDYARETKYDIHKVNRSLNPINHPHSLAREYQRAMVSSKIQKIFAKPFLYSLNDHTDGISCFSKSWENLNYLSSGSFDGDVIVWDLIARRPFFVSSLFEG